MNKVRYILVLCLLSCSVALCAQTFDHVRRNSFWQESRNIAGIRQDSISRSYAEICGRYEEGGFKDTWQAPRTWSAGAVTESIRHFERMSLAGSFSFEQTEGYGMCGSMFAKPGYFPIDVLEFTPGRKTLQTYAFDGGIAYDIDGSWAIGVRMDFESSNIAKRKDLRHANWRLDMTVAPAVLYRRAGWSLGLSPVFSKVSETIDAEQIGTSESSYYAFLDKGLMYGVHQVWTGSGIHLDEDGVKGFPVREYSYGVALQAQYRNLYADVEVLRTTGSIGEKEYIWFEFPGLSISSELKHKWRRSSAMHSLSLHFDWKRQDMDENVLEKISSNGITTVLDHGTNRILSKSSWTLSPEYSHEHELMDARIGIDFCMSGAMASQIYPYVHTQTLTELSPYIGFMFHYGIFDLGANGRYGKGWVSESERLASGDSGVQSVPFRLQDWHDRHMEYMTASRFIAEIVLRYNFRKGIYLETNFQSVEAYGLKHIEDPRRFSASLKIGYDF